MSLTDLAFPYWRLAAVGVVLAALIGAAFWIQGIRSERDVAVADLRAAESANGSLRNDIKLQNKAIEGLMVEGAHLQDRADARVAAAQAETKAGRASLDRLRQAKPGADLCVSAGALIDAELGR